MYLHIGNGVSVRSAEVIALCDSSSFAAQAEGSVQVSINRDYLDAAGARGRVISCLEPREELRTLVITDKGIYLSPVSSSTLRRRQQMVLGNYD